VTSPRPLDLDVYKSPNRDYGILPFWFLNGELDPDEMLYQLGELRAKGMQGVIFHGRYGLEMPYVGDTYLERVKFGVEEANRLGLTSWIYDEMNWPSGTADKRVLKARPDLAQRYLECVWFSVRGPWFMCLTGEDSRYMDFQRSTPVAVFAVGEDGAVVDLTSNLSFERVVPWEVPPGSWNLYYIVEKRADYYIDALDPESTETFLSLGYAPYLKALGSNGSGGAGAAGNGRVLEGFYSDEPAMHYFLTAADNAIVPWTKNMFRRFQERNGYNLRPRLLDLFFDIHPDAARTRYDFYNTTTAFYSDAYYRQIHEWCQEHHLTFTAHLLFEEWLRQMVRVEGNAFRHYEHMDVVAVDHLYPIIGTRENPAEHVAIKLASSAAHHFGSERLICESFGGIFMDATMQRMKWIADWEYVLGVTVINPHGFHYTFEGARKRDWPPSMFYQYPWWRY
jgi:alpha-L-rhamnosidase